MGKPQIEPDWQTIRKRRRDAARAAFGALSLDALLVCSQANRFYLSGFELSDSQPRETAGMILLTSEGNDWLATDSRYADAARRLWPEDRIFIYGGNMTKDLAGLLKSQCAYAGVETRAASYQFMQELSQKCGFLPAVSACNGIVENLRAIKEPCEIEALNVSFELNQKMFDWLETRVRAMDLTGKSEAELAWEIEKFFREHGAQGLAFPTIVAFGKMAHCLMRFREIPDCQRIVPFW